MVLKTNWEDGRMIIFRDVDTKSFMEQNFYIGQVVRDPNGYFYEKEVGKTWRKMNIDPIVIPSNISGQLWEFHPASTDPIRKTSPLIMSIYFTFTYKDGTMLGGGHGIHASDPFCCFTLEVFQSLPINTIKNFYDLIIEYIISNNQNLPKYEDETGEQYRKRLVINNLIFYNQEK